MSLFEIKKTVRGAVKIFFPYWYQNRREREIYHLRRPELIVRPGWMGKIQKCFLLILPFGLVEKLQTPMRREASLLKKIKSLQAKDASRVEAIRKLQAKDASRVEAIRKLQAKDASRVEAMRKLQAKEAVCIEEIRNLQEKDAANGKKIRDLRKKGRCLLAPISVLHRTSGIRHDAEVTVVIPVYNHVDLLEKCTDALLMHTAKDVELCFINDKSPEPAIGAFLDEIQKREPGRVTVLTNEKNLGFPATCNRGMEHAGSRDVVLLNSDTAVTPRWLENLRIAAYGNDLIGTVSAVSNNSGFVSVPVPPEAGPLPSDNASPEAEKFIPSAEIIDQVGRAYLHRQEILLNTPTGHGFCLYVKRAMLDEVGLLDAVTFGKGYGEEVDLCMRAYRAGWMHCVTTKSFVWHYNGAAFGPGKKEKIDHASSIINQRYPEYEYRKNLMKGIWKKKKEALTDVLPSFQQDVTRPRPRLLFIIGVKNGGTAWTNRDLMESVSDKYEPFLLYCNGRELSLFDFSSRNKNKPNDNGKRLGEYALNNEFAYFDGDSDEMNEVILNWVAYYGIELVHVRHLAHFSTGFLAGLRRLHVPVVFSFHDFFAISPTVKLLDQNNVFHGDGITDGTLPDSVVMSRRIDTPLPGIDDGMASRWKKMYSKAVFPNCRFFVTTCNFAKELLQKHFTDLTKRDADFKVIPHGYNVAVNDFCSHEIDAGAPVKILYLGNCTVQKGGEILTQVIREDAAGRIQFHLVGKINPLLDEEMQVFAAKGRLILHGEYVRGGEAEIVRSIMPDFAVIPSIWPETWCHTLTECWAMGLPVLAFDVGALGERIKNVGGGWLLPLGCSTQEILHKIIQIAGDRDDFEQKRECVRQWQQGAGKNNTTERMASEYKKLYDKALSRERERS